MKTNMRFWSYFVQFFLQLETFETKVVEKIKTHILCSITHFYKNRAVSEIMWKKYSTARHVTHNMAHTHCMLGNWCYRHTHSEYATLITRARPSVMLHVNCLSALHHTIYNSKEREKLLSMWLDLAYLLSKPWHVSFYWSFHSILSPER